MQRPISLNYDEDPSQLPSEQRTAGSQATTAEPVYDRNNLAYSILTDRTESWKEDGEAFTELQSVFERAIEAMEPKDDPRHKKATDLLSMYKDRLAIYDERYSNQLEDSDMSKMVWNAACDNGNELASLIFSVADSNTTGYLTYGSSTFERPQTEMLGSYVDSRRETVAQGTQDIGPPVLFGQAIIDPCSPRTISRRLLDKIRELDGRKNAHYEWEWAPRGTNKAIKSNNVRTAEVGEFSTTTQRTFLFCVTYGADAYNLICKSHIWRNLAQDVERHEHAVAKARCVNVMAFHIKFGHEYRCRCGDPKHKGFRERDPGLTRPWENWQIEMVLSSLLELEELMRELWSSNLKRDRS